MNIIIFDDECILCSKALAFVIKHDVKKKFLFSSMQEDKALTLIQKYRVEGIDSIILIKQGICYIHSDAVLQICKDLEGWPYFFYFFKVLPLSFRDFVYTFIAKHRYSIFGKRQSCLLMDNEIKDRLL